MHSHGTPDLGIVPFSLKLRPRDLNPKVTKPSNTPANHTMLRQLCHSVTPLIVFLLIITATIPVSASSSSIFCKCSCLTNSTLIPISGPDSSSPKTCIDCNRQFCRDYNLPFCKGVEDEDIFTTCFQRDSAKDQAVVLIFMFATIGLLGYAIVRPWVSKWVDAARQRRYTALPAL